jgi:hypothetical protein
MIRGNALLQPHVAEYAFRPLIFPAHNFPSPKESSKCRESHSTRRVKRLFQQPAVIAILE